jgi:hypothetical protein
LFDNGDGVLREGGVMCAEIGVEEGVTDGFEGADMGVRLEERAAVEERRVVILLEWKLLTRLREDRRVSDWWRR